MKLTLFEKAITWCDEGLSVSFEFDCIFMDESAKTLHRKIFVVEGTISNYRIRLVPCICIQPFYLPRTVSQRNIV